MAYSLKCGCGRSISVGADQAGMAAACECGGRVAVPSLGKLREMSGRDSYESGTIDIIVGMLKRGELPAGDRCAVSGEPTRDTIELSVEAERVHLGKDDTSHLWLALIWWPALLFGLGGRRTPDVGRQTIVPTPLRVEASQRPRFLKASQKKRKRWLRTVPIYARLLHDYPDARVLTEQEICL